MMNSRPQVNLDGHYSMTETARLLSVDRRTIYRWRKSGYLKDKAYRHCSKHFVTGREILKIFNACN